RPRYRAVGAAPEPALGRLPLRRLPPPRRAAGLPRRHHLRLRQSRQLPLDGDPRRPARFVHEVRIMSSPPAPRPAATVVLLQPGAHGPEVLMVRRTRAASFMADAYVFPGGRVDPEDGDGEPSFAVAAARELREEVNLDVDPAALVPFARWITPSHEPKRFDA